jgi:UDP-N-acetylglucosamine 2-epimerase (non-hydrolysing)
LRIPVGHVEAGLRTGDRFQPFPEEVNRRVADAVADIHFPPTEKAADNLRREGVAESSLVVTGNTAIDALLYAAALDRPSPIDPLLTQVRSRRIITVTAHRRESFGEPLLRICEAIERVAGRFRDDVHFVYPVHLNPNVQAVVRRRIGHLSNVSLLEPLDYFPFVKLLRSSYLIMTDSGGIQEEAPSLGKPVLVLREVTERPEAVQAGVAKVVGTSAERIEAELAVLLTDRAAYNRMACMQNPFGDGHASERIVAALAERSAEFITGDRRRRQPVS